tara:strand:- start:914 stop:3460 length:2547 start_codon:yes stop_codon:yes gene_type:complete
MKLSHSLLSGLALTLLAFPVFSNSPIVQPGAPGELPRELSAEEAIEVADTRYTASDAQFMRDMIPHHLQALEMSRLAPDRTNSPELLEIAGKIEAAQGDEIAFMEQWLTSRGESIDRSHAHGDHHRMKGMATEAQMAALAAASGVAFDRQFLSLMIAHHEGAIEMVEALMEQPGSAYDPTLFEFTTDVTNDQSKEIELMHGLLLGLSDDPRASLAAGLYDAEEAIWNLRKVAVLTKPPGFYDPANPADLPPERFLPTGDETTTDQVVAEEQEAHAHHHGEEHVDGSNDMGAQAMAQAEENASEDYEKETDETPDPRSPLLSFSNTDIAFRDDIMVAGSYHGFNIYALTDDGQPDLTASVVCPGGQGDVSIVDDLLIMSVEETRGRVDCGLEGVTDEISNERFRGLRIFNISDLTRPKQVGAVQTCRGSHTHSVVSGPDADGKLIVYNSGISRVRDEEELPGCFDESPGDDRTALFRIDVIEIPVDNPAASRIIDSPTVFADPETGALAGLWRGGDHGEDTQETSRTDECHDITVFPSLNLAAGACSGNGILFDITDPRTPERVDAVSDSGFAYWHSATFNNDGSKVLFTDEWGGGGRPRCRTYDPLTWGADAIYDIVDGKLTFRSHFKMPAPQGETENCVAHNGSIIPVPGRDIFVQAWYQGGLSIIDFTDSANPIEIAYFDRGPIDDTDLVTGGYWSTYWYQGRIYGTEIVRGIDVFALSPSEHLSANEIAAAEMANQGGLFNPQQQFPVSWPSEPTVSLAYLDQWLRDHPEQHQTLAALYETLRDADTILKNKGQDTALAASLSDWADASELSDATALRESLRAISRKLSVGPPTRLISQAAPQET